MRILIIQLFFAITVFGRLYAQPITYTKADGKTYVRLISKQHHTKPETGYDAEMLIPHWNPDTRKWGYIRRDSKELVVPHRFFSAGTFGAGFAIAVELQDDSLGQDVYRIDKAGAVKCIYKDTSRVAPETIGNSFMSHRETMRKHDDYVTIIRGNMLTLISPVGERLFERLIPTERYKLNYLCAGRFCWDLDSIAIFTDQFGNVSERYSFKEYQFPSLHAINYGKLPNEAIQPLVRLRDSKVGLVGSAGQILVPIVWDTAATWVNGGFQSRSLSDIRLANDYDPGKDSLFFAWRDGSAHLVHLNGNVVYRYARSQAPVGSHFMPRWDEWGLIPVIMKDDWGKTKAYAYLDPKTGGTIVSGNQVQIINANVVAKLVTTSINERYYLTDIRTSREVVIQNFEKHDEWLITQTYRYNGRYYHTVQDRMTNLKGVVNDCGEIMIPCTKSEILCGSDDGSNASILAKEPTKEAILQRYTPDGKLLIEADLRPERNLAYKSENPRIRYFLTASFRNDLSYGIPQRLAFPNLLEMAPSRRYKSRDYLGFLDIYGNVYY